jgi:hypothetical protein
VKLQAFRFGAVFVPVCMLVATASAQSPVPLTGHQNTDAEMRSQIAMLEGVLERSVQIGISNAIQKIPGGEFAAPIWTDEHRARGFYLDSFGVFVDVEMPTLNASFTWTVQLLSLNDAAISRELERLKAVVARVSDPKERADIEQSMVRLQQLASPPQGQQFAAAGSQPPRPGVPTPASDVRDLGQVDPTGLFLSPDYAELRRQVRTTYRSEVQKVLVEAMLSQGSSLHLAPEEKLTVAARGEGPSTLGPDDQNTILYLTILGKDLAAYGAGQITKEEAVKRVQVTNR